MKYQIWGYNLISEIEQTRKKIKSLLPRWYELKCETQDKLMTEYPINLEFLKNGTSVKYNSDEVINYMRDKLAEEYMRAIYYAYDELVYMYACSFAANIVSIELEKDGDEGSSGYWELYVRNFYFRNFVPRFWSILDYLAFMVYQLSAGKLFPESIEKEPNWISFIEFEKDLKKTLKINFDNDIGWLSCSDRKKIFISFNKPFKKITPYGRKLLKRYRDIITHRYLPGIDEMTISTEIAGTKTLTSEYGKLFSIEYDKKKYDYYGEPEFNFSTLIVISKILLGNLTDILNDFSSLEVMSSVIKIT